MKNPFTRRIQIQWMLVTAFAVVSIAGCTSISGTLTWNKGDFPSPIIGALGVPNPTLQDEIKLQARQYYEFQLYRVLGRVTYGKVSISGREVSVPYLIDALPAPTTRSAPVKVLIVADPKPGGIFIHGPYDPNNDVYSLPQTGELNPVTLGNAPITGFDLNYYKRFILVSSGKKQLHRKHGSQHHVSG
jgi:hypothetical protein